MSIGNGHYAWHLLGNMEMPDFAHCQKLSFVCYSLLRSQFHYLRYVKLNDKSAIYTSAKYIMYILQAFNISDFRHCF